MYYKNDYGIVRTGGSIIVLRQVATINFLADENDHEYQYLYINGIKVGPPIYYENVDAAREEFDAIIKEYTKSLFVLGR